MNYTFQILNRRTWKHFSFYLYLFTVFKYTATVSFYNTRTRCIWIKLNRRSHQGRYLKAKEQDIRHVIARDGLYLADWLCEWFQVCKQKMLNPHDALKHHFTSLKTDLIFQQIMALEWKFPWNWFTNTWQFSSIFKPHQIIFIHYKSRIATAIRGLQWMKMTTVISGLKGLNKKFRLIVRALQCIHDPFHFSIYESGDHTVRKPGITAHVDPGKQETSANAGLKLAHRLRCWPNMNF